MTTYAFLIEVTAKHVWRVEADFAEEARQMSHGELPGKADNLSWEVTGLFRDGEAVEPIPEIPDVHRGEPFTRTTRR